MSLATVPLGAMLSSHLSDLQNEAIVRAEVRSSTMSGGSGNTNGVPSAAAASAAVTASAHLVQARSFLARVR